MQPHHTDSLPVISGGTGLGGRVEDDGVTAWDVIVSVRTGLYGEQFFNVNPVQAQGIAEAMLRASRRAAALAGAGISHDDAEGVARILADVDRREEEGA